MRETLKEVEKKGIRRIIGHLNIEDTYNLLKSVSTQGKLFSRGQRISSICSPYEKK